MKRTISVMVGKGSVNHNSRKFHAENTDPERTSLNRSYCNEDITEVYHELFDTAVQRYNEKQTRTDRIIKDYYRKIQSGKQEKSFHEIILQVGNKDDMNATTADGMLAAKVLDEYMQRFQKRNPNLHVFSAHLHMDEATPHLHIDFVPFTTGSKRGLDTRVSLKQALTTQGFKGGSRQETEWNQWVSSEKKQLAAVMERHGIEWEQKGTHEKHLSGLNYEKKVRIMEVEQLGKDITDKKEEFDILSKRVKNFEQGEKSIADMQRMLDTDPEYKLSEPPALMTAKSYKSRFVEPLINRLKSLIKSVLVRYFQARDNYERLNQENGKLYRENEGLRSSNHNLTSENAQIKNNVKDYNLLRKVFGNQQIDSLLEQAKLEEKSQKRRSRGRGYER